MFGYESDPSSMVLPEVCPAPPLRVSLQKLRTESTHAVQTGISSYIKNVATLKENSFPG